ncbi:MAG TPA: IS3 family transposase [Sideroxyarcus sp.]|nr:IS3 family transposase [Sideroxyarcus sp.]
MAQGCQAKLVAETIGISRSSLYYKQKPHPSRADRSWDDQIIVACGDKPAYGYRRVTWWLRRKQGVLVNGKRVLRVMRERGLLVTPRRLRARRKKEWSRIVAELPNQVWQSDMTKVWAGANVGWAYLVSVIDCCTREIVGWDLSLRCRTEEAIAAVERAVLEQMAEGSRGSGLVLNTDNGTQFTSARFVETLSRLGITHRRTAFNHPEGNGVIERFHRSLKEEEIWLNEYRSLNEARESIGRWIEEYNHDRPHRALNNQTPREARAGFAQPQPLTKTKALGV